MKDFVSKLLFGGPVPAQYPAVRIAKEKILEKVMLSDGNNEIDITHGHSIACQSPFCVVVWLDVEMKKFRDAKSAIRVEKNGKTLSSMEARFLTQVEGDGYCAAIFEITSAKNLSVGFLARKFLDKEYRQKTNLTPLETEIYGALYAYPREVILVSFRQGDYYNIFPMDFQGYDAQKRMYYLGLRTSNITVEKIISYGKVVVGATDDASLDIVYNLGKHHGKNPPPLNQIGFDVIESDIFGFPVPAFIKSYKEIEIINHYRTGSHILLIGKVLNDVNPENRTSPIHHIHGFHRRALQYPKT